MSETVMSETSAKVISSGVGEPEPDEDISRMTPQEAIIELTRLSEEMGLYETRTRAVQLDEVLMAFFIDKRAKRAGMTPDEYAQEILFAYRSGEIGEGWEPRPRPQAPNAEDDSAGKREDGARTIWE